VSLEEVKMAVTPKVVEVDSWEVLKTVLKTDLEYWHKQETAALLDTKSPEEVVKVALSIIGASIGITEYYIEVMQQIESGELVERERPS
jgi:hypothetical protein